MRFSKMINMWWVSTCRGVERSSLRAALSTFRGERCSTRCSICRMRLTACGNFYCSEPRGKVAQCVNLVLPSTNAEADLGFIIMESQY